MSLINELKRRNVLRVAAAYVVTAWLIIQVVETIFPIYELSDSAIRYVITALAIGFVPVIVLAWIFEFTPEGIKRDSDVDVESRSAPKATRNLDRAIMVVLVVAIAYFAFDKFVLSESREAAIAEAAREEGRTAAVLEEFDERSIAVLAFADMSPEGDQEYMSDGIAEEILNLLAKIPDLRVISRSSAFSFKGKNLPIPEIGASLSAAFVLEGSVRKSGRQIRVTAQLIEAATDTHRWSETYDRSLENIFDIQDDIAARVVDQLQANILDGLPKSQRIDEEAYSLVLQARYMWYRRADGDEQEVLRLYQRAVEIDAGIATAWTGLSVAYAVAAAEGRIDRVEGLKLAREAVEQALLLDPENAEARVRLGQALAREGDYVGMLREYQAAFESAPGNPLALGVLANQDWRQGRIDAAVHKFDMAAAADPLGAIWPANKGGTLVRFQRFDEAEQAINRAYQLNGNAAYYRDNKIDILIHRKEFDEALQMLEEMPAQEVNLTRAAIVHHALGDAQKSDELLATIKADTHPFATLGVAMVYAARGDNDLAFEWLYKISGLSPWHIAYDSYIRNMTDDPRWKPYVDSLDWPWSYEY
ncbi:MAG: tetratricopeptide repeat protein [Woeseiaceae bacterium]